MNIGADAADQMLRTGIQITEAAVRLAALGAKNLAALLFALASNPKSRGAITTRRLVKTGQSLLPYLFLINSNTSLKGKRGSTGFYMRQSTEKRRY